MCVLWVVCVVGGGGGNGGGTESGGKRTGDVKEGREVLGWVGGLPATPRGGSTDTCEESPTLPLPCAITGSESHV